MPTTHTLIPLRRDSFARTQLGRLTIRPASRRTPCLWCGSRPGRFTYIVMHDSGAIVVPVNRGGFCSVGCHQSYHS